jgi:FixJ family two-component response regulator
MNVNRPNGIVYVLDDEPRMVRALRRLLHSEGFEVQGFTTPAAFIAAFQPEVESCLVLDVSMPELDGLNFHRRLVHEGILVPVVFLTGHGDISMSVRAMKAGAVDFLTKPVNDADLLGAVRAGLARAAEQRGIAVAAHRLSRLTPREREVLEHVVAGQLNKQIAADLGTGEQNIKMHRARVMQKMEVNSVADLVRVTGNLGIRPNGSLAAGERDGNATRPPKALGLRPAWPLA